MRANVVSTVLILLVGMLFVAVSVILRPVADPTTHLISENYRLAAEGLEILGSTLIVASIFNVLIELKAWRTYFGERLSEIVMEHSYLKSLTPQKLRELQMSIVKTIYPEASIDIEGSFYRYLRQELEQYVSAPYRENVSVDMKYTLRDGKWFVRDKVTYLCRKSGVTIQPLISWGPDSSAEFLSVTSLTIQVQYPYYHELRGTPETIFPSDGKSINDFPGYKISIPLDKYREIDQLVVTIVAEYEVRAERFQTWVMAHPTRNLDFTIRFPDDWEIQLEPILLDAEIMNRGEPEPGYTKVEYDSWVLPGSGLAWRLIPKKRLLAVSHG
jgi:hypothetical protein